MVGRGRVESTSITHSLTHSPLFPGGRFQADPPAHAEVRMGGRRRVRHHLEPGTAGEVSFSCDLSLVLVS